MKTAVVLAFDRLALRFLGCYGNTSQPTPNIDRVAAESVVFDEHFAWNVDPKAAMQTMWNAGDGSNHRLRELSKAGVETHAITQRADRAFGLPSEAFGSYWELPADSTFERLFSSAAQTLREWATEEQRNQRLLWIQCPPIPITYEVDDRPSALSQQYAEGIQSIDALLGAVWDAAISLERNGNVLFVLMSVLGQPLNEHETLPEEFQLPEEFCNLGEATVHTPLIVHVTNHEAGTRRREIVQSTDLPPTLLDWFDVDMTAGDSINLLKLPGDDSTKPPREFAILRDDDRAFGIRNSDFYLTATAERLAEEDVPIDTADVPEELLLDLSGVRLFVKPDDLWEVHDVSEQEPETVLELLAQLRQSIGANTSRD